MNGAKRGRRAVSPAWCENAYGLALARGSSYIASTLTPCSRGRAIAEVVEDFVNQHGEDDLPVFLERLAERLKQRDAAPAAEAVGHAAKQAARRPC